MLQALRPNPGRVRKSDGKSAPPPVWGWDGINTQSEMPDTHAPRLDNWFPQPGWVELRGGYSSWATGMGSSTSIQSLLVYNALNSNNDKLFCAAGTKIYNGTTAGAASEVLSGLTSARWQYINYTTSAGTAYLLACNGSDAPIAWDNSSWSNPSISGVTTTSLININVFKKYVWYIIKDSMDACYLPLDSFQGTATKFPLGSVMQLGGSLMAMATWTLDGGNGADDYAVFISTRGQVAVYSGTDPAADFSLVGVYQIPPPIGRRCFTRVAGDVAVVTISGVIPLSKALRQDRSAEAAIALTNRINNPMNDLAQSYKGNFGWEILGYPLKTAAILNVPTSENAAAVQCVMNTITGAWCKFVGWNMNCFAVFKDQLYAGGNTGVAYKMWTGSIDGSTPIDAYGQCAYNNFGKPGMDKRFTAALPNFTTDQNIIPAIGISTDFKDNVVISTPTAASSAAALYDTAIYDTDVYAPDSRSFSNWTTVSGIGQYASLHFRQSSNSSSETTIQFNGFNITYEMGEFY